MFFFTYIVINVTVFNPFNLVPIVLLFENLILLFCTLVQSKEVHCKKCVRKMNIFKVCSLVVNVCSLILNK